MKEIEIKMIPINKIHSNVNQPRETFDKEKIEEMTKSIEKFGLLNPITVRPFNDGYQIVAGERRWKALQMMNKKEIQAKIVEADDIETDIMSIAENYHREDLTLEEREKSIYTAWKNGKDKLFRKCVNVMSEYTGISERTLQYNITAGKEKEESKSETIQKSSARSLQTTRPLDKISSESRIVILEKLNDEKMTSATVETIVKTVKTASKEGTSKEDIEKIVNKVIKDTPENEKINPENVKNLFDNVKQLPSDLKDKVLNGKIDIEEAKVASSFPTVEQRNQVIQERRILAQRYKEDEQRHIILRKKMSDDVLLGKKPTTMSVQFDVRKSNNDVSSNRILERYQNIHIEVLSYRSDHIMSIENKDIQDRCINVIKQTLAHCNQVLQSISEHKPLLLNEKVKGEIS